MRTIVYFNDLKSDAINILVIYWYHPPACWDYPGHAAWVNKQISECFDTKGIKPALPTQLLYHVSHDKQPLTLNQ